MEITVFLPSGRHVIVNTSSEVLVVRDLAVLVKAQLDGILNRASFLRFSVSGRLLEWEALLPGNCAEVFAILEEPMILAATKAAFALSCNGFSVITWGNAEYGGDSSSVESLLTNVQKIRSNELAFAAITDAGVVCWGSSNDGGKGPGFLKLNVTEIHATQRSFAALLEDSSVVAWGDAIFGGTLPQNQLQKVRCLQATMFAFAAIKEDGSVVTWGDKHAGGDSSKVQHQLNRVVEIQGTGGAFAAILEDRSVVTWGDRMRGGEIPSALQDKLHNIDSRSVFSKIYFYFHPAKIREIFVNFDA